MPGWPRRNTTTAHADRGRRRGARHRRRARGRSGSRPSRGWSRPRSTTQRCSIWARACRENLHDAVGWYERAANAGNAGGAEPLRQAARGGRGRAARSEAGGDVAGAGAAAGADRSAARQAAGRAFRRRTSPRPRSWRGSGRRCRRPRQDATAETGAEAVGDSRRRASTQAVGVPSCVLAGSSVASAQRCASGSAPDTPLSPESFRMARSALLNIMVTAALKAGRSLNKRFRRGREPAGLGEGAGRFRHQCRQGGRKDRPRRAAARRGRPMAS